MHRRERRDARDGALDGCGRSAVSRESEGLHFEHAGEKHEVVLHAVVDLGRHPFGDPGTLALGREERFLRSLTVIIQTDSMSKISWRTSALL